MIPSHIFASLLYLYLDMSRHLFQPLAQLKERFACLENMEIKMRSTVQICYWLIVSHYSSSNNAGRWTLCDTTAAF